MLLLENKQLQGGDALQHPVVYVDFYIWASITIPVDLHLSY